MMHCKWVDLDFFRGIVLEFCHQTSKGVPLPLFFRRSGGQSNTSCCSWTLPRWYAAICLRNDFSCRGCGGTPCTVRIRCFRDKDWTECPSSDPVLTHPVRTGFRVVSSFKKVVKFVLKKMLNSTATQLQRENHARHHPEPSSDCFLLIKRIYIYYYLFIINKEVGNWVPGRV